MPDLAITSAGRLDGSDARMRIHQAARAFENLCTQQMLKPLTGSGGGDDEMLGSDPGTKMFKGMLVEGLAEHAAGGMGIARIIEQTMLHQLHSQAARPQP